MGLLPHTSPHEVYASEYYKADFQRYSERLNIAEMEFKRLLPSLFLPTFLRNTLGYSTHAMVSMPSLRNLHSLPKRSKCSKRSTETSKARPSSRRTRIESAAWPGPHGS